VTGNTISGQIVRRCKVHANRYHPLPLTGSRWDTQWLGGGGKTPTFYVFMLFSVSVMKTCCDSCGDGEYNFRSGCSSPDGAVV
jgi:hypothetical protein